MDAAAKGSWRIGHIDEIPFEEGYSAGTEWKPVRRFEPRPATDVVRRRDDWRRAVECVRAFGSPTAAD